MLVGEDTDLLVLALHAITIPGVQQKITIMRSSSDSSIYVQKIHQSHTREVIDKILPVHALSRCDTVSPLYGTGKTIIVQSLDKYLELAEHLEVFL